MRVLETGWAGTGRRNLRLRICSTCLATRATTGGSDPGAFPTDDRGAGVDLHSASALAGIVGTVGGPLARGDVVFFGAGAPELVHAATKRAMASSATNRRRAIRPSTYPERWRRR